MQLKQVINVSQLHAVVQRYAFEMNLGAEILELIGIMSQKLHQYALQSDTELQDLISDQQYQFWLTKLVELTNVRLYLRDLLLQSQQVDVVCLQMATHIIESKTPWLNQLRHSKYKVLGIQQRVLQFMQEQQQTIEAKLEFRLANIIKNSSVNFCCFLQKIYMILQCMYGRNSNIRVCKTVCRNSLQLI